MGIQCVSICKYSISPSLFPSFLSLLPFQRSFSNVPHTVPGPGNLAMHKERSLLPQNLHSGGERTLNE